MTLNCLNKIFLLQSEHSNCDINKIPFSTDLQIHFLAEPRAEWIIPLVLGNWRQNSKACLLPSSCLEGVVVWNVPVSMCISDCSRSVAAAQILPFLFGCVCISVCKWSLLQTLQMQNRQLHLQTSLFPFFCLNLLDGAVGQRKGQASCRSADLQ